MSKKECIAMILAGGQGSRLATLTTQIPKPAIPFGGSCRLIDFSLSNCYNSGLDTIGVLTAKQSSELSKKIGSLLAQNLPRDRENAHTLAATGINGLSSYTGTANAVYENINFIEQFHPKYILVLSGDHVYKMDYRPFLEYHKERGADVTISTIEVPWLHAPRFGIINTSPDSLVVDFAEKPIQPKSNLASMGVYLFSWPKLKKYLEMDEANAISSHDFGKNIIPTMLRQGEKIYSYPFTGYWKDVGTIESLYQANMDLLSSPPIFDIHDEKWPIYSTLTDLPLPVLVATRKSRSLISENCSIYGKIEQSVVFPAVFIGNNTKVKNSVIMPGAYIGHGAYIENAIIGPGAAVKNCHVVLGDGSPNIAVIAQNSVTSSMQIEFGHYPSNQKNLLGEIFKGDVLYW